MHRQLKVPSLLDTILEQMWEQSDTILYKTLCGYFSKAIMRTTEARDIQAMDIITPDNQNAPQDVQAMDISPPDDH